MDEIDESIKWMLVVVVVVLFWFLIAIVDGDISFFLFYAWSIYQPLILFLDPSYYRTVLAAIFVATVAVDDASDDATSILFHLYSGV